MSVGLNVVALAFAFNCLYKMGTIWENTKEMVQFNSKLVLTIINLYVLLLALTSLNNLRAAG